MTADELLLSEDLPPYHRSGYVSVIGRPSAGKSTLMNALLGQKIAIVSAKPQTTRNRILGILTRPEAQVIFADTPGIHKPMHKLGEFMVETAKRAIPDADVICFIVDVSTWPTDEDREIAALLRAAASGPVILALNKADLLTVEDLAARAKAYRALGSYAAEYAISALRGDNLDALLAGIIGHLPPGPRYYPADQVTDQMERFIAAELIREQVIHSLRQEIPYVVAVVVEQFKERPDGVVYIEANIFVEKDSQKKIVIGRGGSMLKQIGQVARREIEAMLEVKVYLELWVKVRENWRKKDEELRRLGYMLPRS